MADVTATDNFHQMKRNEEGRTEHHELRPAAESEESDHDLQKHASHEAGHYLSHIETEDGENVVTAKTWLVVVVRYPCSIKASYS